MPVSGFKKDDKVLTPAGKRAVVLWVNTRGSSTARVRDENGTVRVFRQAALRYAEGSCGHSNAALATFLTEAVATGNDEAMLEAENDICDRLDLDLNETEQGLTENAVKEIEGFVSTALALVWTYERGFG